MSLLAWVLGRPLASSEERSQKIGPLNGIPVFGLDALGSAAYGPEAALTVLIPLGLAGLNLMVPLSAIIIALLTIVYFSYRQTIEAYPNGGGSYIVARHNLGTAAGLFAAAALLIDYVLDAAVGISTGVGALTSAIPQLHPHAVLLCLIALIILTFVNLRGVRETGAAFSWPTYLFLLCMAALLVVGLIKTMLANGHPVALVSPHTAKSTAAFSVWLLIRAYGSGCAALTGVEAVSNGVAAFRDDKIKNAQRTLGLIVFALAIMLAGIAVLVKAYGIVATDPNGSSYQSVLSMLCSAVMGHGWFYYVSMFSVLILLTLSANTAFADFPRVCHFLADDGFLPSLFANRGRRLVYTVGIVVLAILTAALLIVFGGITDRLIPLFAVGAFLAFTMSQAGMVVHWRRLGGAASGRKSLMNAIGATATGLTVLLVIIAKFTAGAWITIIAIPVVVCTMYFIRREYQRLTNELQLSRPLEPQSCDRPILVVAMQSWNTMSERALQFAFTISDEIRVVSVAEEDQANDLGQRWEQLVANPSRRAHLQPPELTQLHSVRREVVTPIVDFVKLVAGKNKSRRVIVIIPELVERRWFQRLLHTQRAEILKVRLLAEHHDQIAILNVPWHQQSW